MTNTTRREKVEALLALEPQDQFLRYSLACEFDNEERFDESIALFEGLQKDSVPLVAAYLRGAQLLVRMDRVNDARSWLRTGIETARQQGNSHAAGEMAELLTQLGSMGE